MPDSCCHSTPTAELPTLHPFADTLARSGGELRRGETTTLQVSVGFLCNQSCRHCHLSAGPGRSEVMSRETMAAVVAFAKRGGFSVIDLTGGAPELVPGIEGFLETLSPLAPRILFRANLTALAGRPDLAALLARLRVVIVASFPSLSASQTDTQRGDGVFQTSIGTLRMLNAAGYGREGSGLELDLVSNPVGAFLPQEQAPAQAQFHRELAGAWGVTFNQLHPLANMPLGRFRSWLTSTGNLEGYLRQLAENFNPCTVGGLMCRNLLSVSWDGVLYDCDFNLARGLPQGGVRRHVSSAASPPPPGTAIATGDHCYACTAGSGFT
ncbi:MAG: arsenosugar biosynthesis radical SAM (seleno)protein ArsS [Candidatus Methylomirabilia bacterium]